MMSISSPRSLSQRPMVVSPFEEGMPLALRSPGGRLATEGRPSPGCSPRRTPHLAAGLAPRFAHGPALPPRTFDGVEWGPGTFVVVAGAERGGSMKGRDERTAELRAFSTAELLKLV